MMINTKNDDDNEYNNNIYKNTMNLFSPIRTTADNNKVNSSNNNNNNKNRNSNNKLKDPNFLKYENIVSTPSLRQRMKMKDIINSGFKLVDEMYVQQLLRKLHSLLQIELQLGPDGPFRYPLVFTEFHRISPYWKIIFGFSKEDPILDINKYAINGENERNRKNKIEIVQSLKEAKLRGRWNGGCLSIEFLIYFLETRNFAAKQMIRKRMMFSEVDLSYGTYPWAQVGMEIIRLIGYLFEFINSNPSIFIDPITQVNYPYDHDGPNLHPTRAGSFSYQSWWGIIMEKNWFERLFVCTFLIFDSLFEKNEKACVSLGSMLVTNTNMHHDLWDSIDKTLYQSKLTLLDYLEKNSCIDEIESNVCKYIADLKLSGEL